VLFVPKDYRLDVLLQKIAGVLIGNVSHFRNYPSVNAQEKVLFSLCSGFALKSDTFTKSLQFRPLDQMESSFYMHYMGPLVHLLGPLKVKVQSELIDCGLRKGKSIYDFAWRTRVVGQRAYGFCLFSSAC
jgi:hypothetical protein